MGGEAKKRGSKEERVSKALEKKELEKEKNTEHEIAWCFHQRYFEDNINLFLDDIEGEKNDDRKNLLKFLDNNFKKMFIGQVAKTDFSKYKNWPFLTITVKKQSKYVFKVIHETIYGITSTSFSPNGTAGWHIVDSVNEDIFNRCYDRIALLRYVTDKVKTEFNLK